MPRAHCFAFLAPLLLVACTSAPVTRPVAPRRSIEASMAPMPGGGQRMAAEFGVEAYPAGVITTIGLRHQLDERDEVSLRIGHNEADRQDFGEHDDETGGGQGFGVGWRRYVDRMHEGLFFGARVDNWWLEIDWEEDGTEGTTDIVVVQPTAEVGYAWPFGEGWTFTALVALGAEINVETDGEDVGEGAILLGGLGLTFGF